jgi:hypothetical protein
MVIERAGMGRNALTIATDTRHGSELILRYLDAAWADCVVSVDSGAAHFCALQGFDP